ncbi:MAG TPA: sulfotransferase [Phycisphaerae bacterium]|nr:sulfotransferase [Phycisphaerae bacterium]
MLASKKDLAAGENCHSAVPEDGPLPPAGNLSGAFRPTFVVGCERSGTTLLAVMIGRHSSIAMMPETHFFLRVVPRRLSKESGAHAELLERFRRSPRAIDLEFDRAEVLARFSQMPPTYAGLFETLMTMYAERWGKPMGGEKTPFHLLRVPLIVKWFPEARIVGIVRDGRDVVRSIMSAPWTAHRSLRRHCWKWAQSAELSRRLVREYPRNFMLIRYEDLVSEPEKTLRDVDAFLGVPFEAGQIEAGGPSPVVPERERGWKANAVGHPDKSRIGAWEKEVTTRERLIMNSLMGPELRVFGYGNTELPTVSGWRRFVNGTKNELCKIGLYRLWGNILRYTSLERRRKRAMERRETSAVDCGADENSDSGTSIEPAV